MTFRPLTFPSLLTCLVLLCANALSLAGSALAQPIAALPSRTPFELKSEVSRGFVSSLRHAGDADRVEFIRPGSVLGPVVLRVRTTNAPWHEPRPGTDGLAVRSQFRAEGETLWWDVTVKNTGAVPLEIGDLGLPLPMNTDYVWDHEETFVRRVFRHAFIAGHGSFLYWLPVKGTGHFLVLQPQAGTSLEYFTATGMDYAHGKERFTVFVHSQASAELEPRGTWRQSRTSGLLRPGEESVNRFALRWAE